MTDAVNSPATGEVTDDIQSEIITLGANNIGIDNNIFSGRPGEQTIAVFTSTVTSNNNLIFAGNGPYSLTANQNITGQDPKFTDAANGNFQLTNTSPAINAGSNTAGQFSATDVLGITRPKGVGVDIGAYELLGTPIFITQQPASGSAVCEGASVTALVSVSGTVTNYQWYKDGNALTGVDSATTPALSLSGVTTTDVGSYSVVIPGFNSLTPDAFSLGVSNPPTNASLTSGTLTCANTSVTLTDSATGDSTGETFSYTLNGGQQSA